MYTDEQNLIIQHPGGHAKVSAVAGSGKTTTMIGRVAHLLDLGADPRRILILMFNREARVQFEASLQRRLPQARRLPEVRTYHSFALKCITYLVGQGLMQDWPLTTESWKRDALLRGALGKSIPFGAPDSEMLDEFSTYMDLVKASMTTEGDLLSGFPPFFEKAHRAYEAERERRGIRFFDDLLFDLALCLETSETARQMMENHADHIIVDEYQDTNNVQTIILRVVAGTRAAVEVVGDVDQTIYDFRGSDPTILRDGFERLFPGCTTYTLSQTFRYGHALSLFANHVIVNNKVRDAQTCLSSDNNPATEILVVSEAQATHPIAGILSDWCSQGGKLKDCLVLCRLWAMSLPIELECLSKGIPYRIEGAEGRSVFHRREVVALLGYLRLMNGTLGADPNRKATIQSMLSFPAMYITNKVRDRLTHAILGGADAPTVLVSAAYDAQGPSVKNRLRDRADAWRALSVGKTNLPAGNAIEAVSDVLDLKSALTEGNDRPEAQVERQLTIRGVKRFAKRENWSIAAFLDHCDALRQSMERDARLSIDDHLRISTIHRTKGLESDLVYVTGLEEGYFPYFRSAPIEEGLESERRLFYVAITRAKRKLYCGHCTTDDVAKQLLDLPKIKEWRKGMMSRFIHEGKPALSQAVGRLIHSGQPTRGQSAHDVDMVNAYLIRAGRTPGFSRSGAVGRLVHRVTHAFAAAEPEPETRALAHSSPMVGAQRLCQGDVVFGEGVFGLIEKGMKVREQVEASALYQVARVWRSAVSKTETVLLEPVANGEQRTFEQQDGQLVLVEQGPP